MEVADALTALKAYRAALSLQSVKVNDTFLHVLRRVDLVVESLEGLMTHHQDAPATAAVGATGGVRSGDVPQRVGAHVDYHLQGVLQDARKVLKLLQHNVPAHYAAAAAHVATFAVAELHNASPSTVKLGHALLGAQGALNASSPAVVAVHPLHSDARRETTPASLSGPVSRGRHFHFAMFLDDDDDADGTTRQQVSMQTQRAIAIGVTKTLLAPLVVLPHSMQGALHRLLCSITAIAVGVVDPAVIGSSVDECLQHVSRSVPGAHQPAASASGGAAVVLVLPAQSCELAAVFRHACLLFMASHAQGGRSDDPLSASQRTPHRPSSSTCATVDVVAQRVAALPTPTRQGVLLFAQMCLFVSTDRLTVQFQHRRARCEEAHGQAAAPSYSASASTAAAAEPLFQTFHRQQTSSSSSGHHHHQGVGEGSTTTTSTSAASGLHTASSSSDVVGDLWDDDDLMQILGFIECRSDHRYTPIAADDGMERTSGVRDDAQRSTGAPMSFASEHQPHGGKRQREEERLPAADDDTSCLVSSSSNNETVGQSVQHPPPTPAPRPPAAAAGPPVLLRRWRSRSATAGGDGHAVESQMVQFDPSSSDDDDSPSLEGAMIAVSPDVVAEGSAHVQHHSAHGVGQCEGRSCDTVAAAASTTAGHTADTPLPADDAVPPPLVFQLTNSVRDRRRELHRRIGELGSASVNHASHYDPTATILVVADGVMERTEKYLAFCAAGKSIVSPRYVTDSAANGAWLPLQPPPLRAVGGGGSNGKRCAALEYELSPIRRRWLLALPVLPRQQPLPFAAWKVVLFASRQVAKGIRAILAAGGCSVCIADPEPPDHGEWTPRYRSNSGELPRNDDADPLIPAWTIAPSLSKAGEAVDHSDTDRSAFTTASRLVDFLGDDASVTHVLVEGPLVGDVFVPPKALPTCILEDASISGRKLFTLELLHHVLCVAVSNPFSPATGLLTESAGDDGGLPPTCRLEC